MIIKNRKILTGILAVFLSAQLHLALECGDSHVSELSQDIGHDITLHDHICLHVDVEESGEQAKNYVFTHNPNSDDAILQYHSITDIDYLSPSPRGPPIA